MLVLLLLLISGLINRSGLGISHSKVFSSVLTWNSRISPELFQWASGLSSDGFYLKVSLCHFNVQVGFVVTVFYLKVSLCPFSVQVGLVVTVFYVKVSLCPFSGQAGLVVTVFTWKLHSVLSVVKRAY